GGYREQIEKEVEKRLKSVVAEGLSPRQTATAEAVALQTAEALAVQDAACSSCGTANDPDARFCKSCGTRL
ncbi:MAG: zinc-ribbon domain-containing protein, partial [Vicinamibacterales bacterium]